MKYAVITMLVLCLVSPAFSEYSTDDLLNMTVSSLKADRERDTAFVRGVGKISQAGSVGVHLARRTAIADAQRGLLILKRSIEENRPPRIDSVSGHVPGLRVKSEQIRDGLYFVEAEVSLSELLGREREDDEGYDYEDDDESEYDDEDAESSERPYNIHHRKGIYIF